MSPIPDAAAAESAQPLSFEAAYAELQQVVAQLEASNVDLERAIELVERGTRLVATCERLVAQAELRVTRLAAETPFPATDAASLPSA